MPLLIFLLVFSVGTAINANNAGVKTLSQAQTFAHQELAEKPIANYSHLNQ